MHWFGKSINNDAIAYAFKQLISENEKNVLVQFHCMHAIKTILSTKQIAPAILAAYGSHVTIDCMPFIQTIACPKEVLEERFEVFAGKKINAVFTSANAVNAILDSIDIDAFVHIYCIEGNTQKNIQSVAGNGTIKGTASNAELLADLIIRDKPEDSLYFFCGNRRLDTLPNNLKDAGIRCIEIPVYETGLTPQVVEKEYDAILFFSPSAVESFFSVNRLPAHTVVFAAGNTTASAVKQYSLNKLLIGSQAKAEVLIHETIDFLDKHIKT